MCSQDLYIINLLTVTWSSHSVLLSGLVTYCICCSHIRHRLQEASEQVLGPRPTPALPLVLPPPSPDTHTHVPCLPKPQTSQWGYLMAIDVQAYLQLAPEMRLRRISVVSLLSEWIGDHIVKSHSWCVIEFYISVFKSYYWQTEETRCRRRPHEKLYTR